MDEKLYKETTNKLAEIEDKFLEIKPLVKVFDIWVKENCYELIPIVNMLNDKINSIAKVLEK